MKSIVVVLPAAGSNTRAADPASALNAVPFELPCTLSVCVRAPHDEGSLRTTWSTSTEPPRSTWTHCGKELDGPSQYVSWLPSLTLDAGWLGLAALAAAVLPEARFGPPAATAVGGEMPRVTRPTARKQPISRLLTCFRIMASSSLSKRQGGCRGTRPA